MTILNKLTLYFTTTQLKLLLTGHILIDTKIFHPKIHVQLVVNMHFNKSFQKEILIDGETYPDLAVHEPTQWRCGLRIAAFVFSGKMIFFNMVMTESNLHPKV